MPKKKAPKRHIKSWETTPGDRKLIEDLRASTGMQSDSDIMRLALRRLAQAEGILVTSVSVEQPVDAA